MKNIIIETIDEVLTLPFYQHSENYTLLSESRKCILNDNQFKMAGLWAFELFELCHFSMDNNIHANYISSIYEVAKYLYLLDVRS